jgi:hypothetical protein
MPSERRVLALAAVRTFVAERHILVVCRHSAGAGEAAAAALNPAIPDTVSAYQDLPFVHNAAGPPFRSGLPFLT